MRFAHGAATALALATLSAGCATRAVNTASVNDATTGSSSSTVLTAQELGRLAGRGTLMDALERLRPSMLVTRGTTMPRVSVDGAPPAELSLLHSIPAHLVREVRMQRSSSSIGQPAIAANGGVILGDVIAVTMMPGGRPQR